MNKLSHFLISSWAATAIAALLCMAIWIDAIMQGDTADVLSYMNLLIYLAFGVLIGRYGDPTTGNRKATLPATLFFMSCAINPQLVPWQEATLYLPVIAGAYHILLGTYRNPAAMGSYFAAFCLIGIASLHSPQLLYLTPILILCSGFMQSLHVRTALAALFGILAPYWIAFGVLFLTDSTHLIAPFIDELTTAPPQAVAQLHLPLGEGNTLAVPMPIVQLVWTLLLVLPGIVHHLLSTTSKVRTRANRYLQIGYMATLLVATLLLPSLYTALQPVVVALAAIVSYDFFTTEKKSHNIWLIALFVIWLLILGLYVWNSFLIS